MDGGKCILQLRGVRPFFSDKFDITRHKQYSMLLDDNPEMKMDFNLDMELIQVKCQTKTSLKTNEQKNV